MMHYSAIGTPDVVQEYLAEFAALAGADELITAHSSPTIDQRLRSVDLLADVSGLRESSDGTGHQNSPANVNTRV